MTDALVILFLLAAALIAIFEPFKPSPPKQPPAVRHYFDPNVSIAEKKASHRTRPYNPEARHV